MMFISVTRKVLQQTLAGNTGARDIVSLPLPMTVERGANNHSLIFILSCRYLSCLRTGFPLRSFAEVSSK